MRRLLEKHFKTSWRQRTLSDVHFHRQSPGSNGSGNLPECNPFGDQLGNPEHEKKPPGLARGAGKVDTLAIRWPSGQVDKLKNIAANQRIVVKESHGIIRTMQFVKNPQAPKLRKRTLLRVDHRASRTEARKLTAQTSTD